MLGMVLYENIDGLHVLRFPPGQLGIVANPIEDSEGDYRPLRLSDAMAFPDVLGAIDGPMFSNCSPGRSYAQSVCADPRFLQEDSQRAIKDLADRGEGGRGLTVSIVGDQASWAEGDERASGARVAVQLYPPLVRDGQAATLSTSGGNGSSVWRAALVELFSGELAFVVAVDSLQGFARRLAGIARWAGYTDGGGSTAMGWRDESGDHRRGSGEDRPVATFLVALEKPPISLPGAGAVLLCGLGTGLLTWSALELWRRFEERRGI